MKYIVSVFLVFLSSSCEKNKSGFVNIEVLVEEYRGTIDVNNVIKTKMEKYTKEKDSIYKKFQRSVAEYQNKYINKRSSVKSKKMYDKLADKSEKIEKYLRSKERMITEENNRDMDSIADYIRHFIETYGKENEYSFIFGQNQTSSLLYGDSTKNLTKEVLNILNEDYKKK